MANRPCDFNHIDIGFESIILSCIVEINLLLLLLAIHQIENKHPPRLITSGGGGGCN